MSIIKFLELYSELEKINSKLEELNKRADEINKRIDEILEINKINYEDQYEDEDEDEDENEYQYNCLAVISGLALVIQFLIYAISQYFK